MQIQDPETYEECKKRDNREYGIFAASTIVLTAAFCAACIYYIPTDPPHATQTGHSSPCVTQVPRVDSTIHMQTSNQI